MGFNLSREANPLATSLRLSQSKLIDRFQSQSRSQSSGDVDGAYANKRAWYVSISVEKPILWRQKNAIGRDLPDNSFNLSREANPLATCQCMPVKIVDP